PPHRARLPNPTTRPRAPPTRRNALRPTPLPPTPPHIRPTREQKKKWARTHRRNRRAPNKRRIIRPRGAKGQKRTGDKNGEATVGKLLGKRRDYSRKRCVHSRRQTRRRLWKRHNGISLTAATVCRLLRHDYLCRLLRRTQLRFNYLPHPAPVERPPTEPRLRRLHHRAHLAHPTRAPL